MPKSDSPEKRRRIFWGLVFLLVGLCILLYNLGLIDQEMTRFWPVILILWGIKKLID